jgi:hypothetical protein
MSSTELLDIVPLVVSVDLDAVAVGVGHLNAHETPVVLPLRLDNARCPEAVARGADGSLVRQPEAEVVRARKLSGDRLPLRERELGPVVRSEDQHVVVFVEALRQAEVLAVERGRPHTIADCQGRAPSAARARRALRSTNLTLWPL